MSGISSVGSSSDPYILQLQQAALQPVNSTASGAISPTAQVASSNSQTASTTSTTSLEEAIQQDVLKAIQDAEQSGNTTDLKSVVHDAIEKALKDAGIDPNDQAASATETQGHKHRHHHHAENAGATGGTADSANSQAQSATGVNSAPNDLLALLQSLGSNSQQNTGNQNGSQQNIVGFLIDIKQ